MTHPYAGQPAHAHWRGGTGTRAGRDAIYRPRVRIGRDTPVATAGSCFAHHFGARLRAAGCTVLDAEPVPPPVPDAVARAAGYRVFSGRYGNVYTARQMRQLLSDAVTGAVDAGLVWQDGGRFRDALRPTVEPAGLGSAAEVLLHREVHLERVRRMLSGAAVFVFTLGLTETWEDRASGRVLPVCPGVAGGRYDPARHVFRNFTVAEVVDDLHAIRDLLRKIAPGIGTIVTVSPVPLMATATGTHVVTASSASKAVLRAAAAEFTQTADDTDYLPSYEIVTHPAFGGPSFDADLRTVSSEGIDRVMEIVLRAHGLSGQAPGRADPTATDDHCDERLLEAFAR